MLRLNEADELCLEVHRLTDQLAVRQAVVSATMRVSTELIRKAERVRDDNQRFYRSKANRLAIE